MLHRWKTKEIFMQGYVKKSHSHKIKKLNLKGESRDV